MLSNNLLSILTSKDKQMSNVCLTSSKDRQSEAHSLIDHKHMNRPSVLLAPSGTTAQLCIPEDQRAPLFVSDLSSFVARTIHPSHSDPQKKYWFKIHKHKLITNTCLVIVDGVTVSTLHDLHLGKKEMRKLHRKRLREGLISPYLGNYNYSDALDQVATEMTNSSSSHKAKYKSQDLGQDNESTCEQPSQKRFKHNMPEVLNGLQTWLPLISALLPSRVEVVSPVLCGNSVVMDISFIRLSSGMETKIKYSSSLGPKTLRLLDSNEEQYRQVRRETISCNRPASPSLEQPPPEQSPPLEETPDYHARISTPTVLYYSQLSNRWDRSASSTFTTSSHYWGKGTTAEDIKLLKSDKFDRRSLLMDLEDMIANKCPVHPKVHSKFSSAVCTDDSNYSEFVGTKQSYIPVRDDSPFFAIDCEFNRAHVDMISIVNECGQQVYMTYVADYYRHHAMTCHVQNCPECRKPSLADVQQHLARHLPPDAILVGHAINNDLTALQMYHPYIIDTSLHFDTDENTPSLSSLANHFLHKAIQLKKFVRHDPTEDALTSLQLLQLKLQHSLSYGSKRLGGFVPSTFACNAPKPVVKEVYCWHLFEYLHWSRNEVSDVRGRVRVLAEDCFEEEWRASSEGVGREFAPNFLPGGKAVLKGVRTNVSDYDLSIAHIKADVKINSQEATDRVDALSALDAKLAQVHASLPDNGMLAVLLIDSNYTQTSQGGDGGNGVFMVGIKGKE